MENRLYMLDDLIENLKKAREDLGQNVPVFIYDHLSPKPLTAAVQINCANAIPDEGMPEPFVFISNVIIEPD